jgi:hypothetical protein
MGVRCGTRPAVHEAPGAKAGTASDIAARDCKASLKVEEGNAAPRAFGCQHVLHYTVPKQLCVTLDGVLQVVRQKHACSPVSVWCIMQIQPRPSAVTDLYRHNLLHLSCRFTSCLANGLHPDNLHPQVQCRLKRFGWKFLGVERAMTAW